MSVEAVEDRIAHLGKVRVSGNFLVEVGDSCVVMLRWARCGEET